LQQLAVRVAQNAERDPAMIELLKRQQLHVTLTVDGKQKQVP